MWGGSSANLDLYIGEVLLDRDLEKNQLSKDDVQVVITVLDKRYKVSPSEAIERDGRTFRVKLNQTVNIDTGGRKTVTVLIAFIVRSQSSKVLTKLCHTSCEVDVRDDQVKKLIFLVDNSSGVRCGSMTIITYKGRQPGNADASNNSVSNDTPKLKKADKEYNFLRSRRLHWPKSRSSTFDVVMESNLDQDPAVAGVEILNLQGKRAGEFKRLTRAPAVRPRITTRTWTAKPRVRATQPMGRNVMTHVAYDKMQKEMRAFQTELRRRQRANPEAERDPHEEAKLCKMKYDLELLGNDITEAEKTDTKMARAERIRMRKFRMTAAAAAERIVEKQQVVRGLLKVERRNERVREAMLRENMRRKLIAFEEHQAKVHEERRQRIEAASDLARAEAREALRESLARKQKKTKLKGYELRTVSSLLAMGADPDVIQKALASEKDILSQPFQREKELQGQGQEQEQEQGQEEATGVANAVGYSKVTRTLTDLPGPRWSEPTKHDGVGRTGLWPTETGHLPKPPLPNAARGRAKKIVPPPAPAEESRIPVPKSVLMHVYSAAVKSSRPPTTPMTSDPHFAQPTRLTRKGDGKRIFTTAIPVHRVPKPLERPAHKPFVPHVAKKPVEVDGLLQKPPVHSRFGDKTSTCKRRRRKKVATPKPPSPPPPIPRMSKIPTPEKKRKKQTSPVKAESRIAQKKKASIEASYGISSSSPAPSSTTKSPKMSSKSSSVDRGQASSSSAKTKAVATNEVVPAPAALNRALTATTAKASNARPHADPSNTIHIRGPTLTMQAGAPTVKASASASAPDGRGRTSKSNSGAVTAGKITMVVPAVKRSEGSVDLGSDSEEGSSLAINAVEKSIKSIESQLHTLMGPDAISPTPPTMKASVDDVDMLSHLDERIRQLTAKVADTSKTMGKGAVDDDDGDSDDEDIPMPGMDGSLGAMGATTSMPGFMSPPSDPAATQGNWEREMEKKFDAEYRDDDDFSRQLREAFPGKDSGKGSDATGRAARSSDSFDDEVTAAVKARATKTNYDAEFDIDYFDNEDGAPMAASDTGDMGDEFDI